MTASTNGDSGSFRTPGRLRELAVVCPRGALFVSRPHHGCDEELQPAPLRRSVVRAEASNAAAASRHQWRVQHPSRHRPLGSSSKLTRKKATLVNRDALWWLWWLWCLVRVWCGFGVGSVWGWCVCFALLCFALLCFALVVRSVGRLVGWVGGSVGGCVECCGLLVIVVAVVILVFVPDDSLRDTSVCPLHVTRAYWQGVKLPATLAPSSKAPKT